MTVKEILEWIIRLWNSGCSDNTATEEAKRRQYDPDLFKKHWSYLEQQYDCGVVPLSGLIKCKHSPFQIYRDQYWDPQAGEELKQIIKQHNEGKNG